MTGRESIRGYKTAMQKISRLETERKKSGLSQHDLSQQSGVRLDSLKKYESGKQQPTVKNYNKLCKVLGWKKITVSTPREEKHFPHKRCQAQEECKSNEQSDVKSVKLPGIVGFKFEEGQKYIISDTVDRKRASVMDYVFSYEGKHVLHHMFREERGKWTRTYTDAQLVGKHITKVLASLTTSTPASNRGEISYT